MSSKFSVTQQQRSRIMQESDQMLYLIQPLIYHEICKLIFCISVLDLFIYIKDFLHN